ncbi:hypothetical protein BD310DRAFT_545381 [Dichomitus squalens]|uniref:Uncharacterized protein n=1 Tax=Dichomitus squalens TaxID=114155 RepID=A0A4Q9PSR2_9APHY|nr:hypothetical protein BD310DRAFT_545381 [Dichomitus squalens]
MVQVVAVTVLEHGLRTVVVGATGSILSSGIFGVATYLLTKDAMNVLLVVNNTTTDVDMTDHKAENGEVRYTMEVGQVRRDDGYRQPGQVLHRNGLPNSILGGNNSIRVASPGSVDGIIQAADSSGTEEERVKLRSGGSVLVRRADNWGNVNWGVCLID